MADIIRGGKSNNNEGGSMVGGATLIAQFRQSFTQADASDLQVLITQNQNADTPHAIDPANIITPSVAITRPDRSPAWSSAIHIPSNRITGTVDSSGLVTLNKSPNSDIIVWYRYKLPADQELPAGYEREDIVIGVEILHAKDIPIEDAGNYFGTDLVEDALQELGRGEWRRQITWAYDFAGTDGSNYIPIPPPLFYPMGYDLVKTLKINGTELVKGTDWRELDPDTEWNGLDSKSGHYGYGGCAWGLVLLGEHTVTSGDSIEVTLEVRRSKYEVLDLHIRRLNDNSDVTDGAQRTLDYWSPRSTGTLAPTREVRWSFPNGGYPNLKVIVFRLNWRDHRNYQSSGPGFHYGKRWRPFRILPAGTTRFSGFSDTRHRAYKFAVLDTSSGAIGRLSRETIVRKQNSAWPPDYSIVIR